eukprot:scaffold112213_cov44-Cyclotella_meneghiniana.AAC.2
MDLTITIVNGRLETTLYEKAMNLYLYLSPHSSHPLGVFTSLIFGQVLRIRRLCSHNKQDADGKILEFFHRLLAKGHTMEALSPIFDKAEKNAEAYLQLSPEEQEALKLQKSRDAHNQLMSQELRLAPLTRCTLVQYICVQVWSGFLNTLAMVMVTFAIDCRGEMRPFHLSGFVPKLDIDEVRANRSYSC